MISIKIFSLDAICDLLEWWESFLFSLHDDSLTSRRRSHKSLRQLHENSLWETSNGKTKFYSHDLTSSFSPCSIFLEKTFLSRRSLAEF